MASSPIISWKIDGETVTDFILGGFKITADGDCSHEIKRHLFLGSKAMTNLESILKSRNITFPIKVCLVKAMVFPVVMYGCESSTIKKAMCLITSVLSDSVQPYGLQPTKLLCPWDSLGKNIRVGCCALLQGIFWPRYWTQVSDISCIGRQVLYHMPPGKPKGWALKKWCFQTVVLEKTPESPLDSKEIQPVHPKGNQPWIVIERTGPEAPILWPPDVKSRLIGKDSDAGKDWRKEEWQRTRWLDDITDSMDMGLSKLQDTVKDKEGWRVAVNGVAKSWT